MRNAEKGTYNGDYTYCPVNGYGDCPYCDQMGICHIDDPQEDCDDWGTFWDSWEDWLAADEDPCAGCPNDMYCRAEGPMCENMKETFAEDEIRWAGDVYGYEDTWEDNEE